MTTRNDTTQPHDDPKARDEHARKADPKPDRHRSDDKRDAISKRLDEALEETFPSSDPVSVKITK